MTDPSQAYKFNTSRDIKTHSTALTNERIAWLFISLDSQSIEMNATYNPKDIERTYSTINQIWKNVRCFFSNHPMTREKLKMNTKVDGVYTIDVSLATADKMILECKNYGWTLRKAYIIAEVINQSEIMIRRGLQYFSYFIKSEQKQKPDISEAAERWSKHSDALTMEKLRTIVGKNNMINWDELGNEENLIDDIEDEEDKDLIEEEDEND